MLFHASIPALNPEHVARVVAEIWSGYAYPFPPFPDSYMVLAEHTGGFALEIYPAGRTLYPGDAEAERTLDGPVRATETHVAIGVKKDVDDILKIAAREGWTARRCARGPFFDVIEVWVENRFMIEALTPEMQKSYVASITTKNWEKTFGFAAPLPAVTA